MAIEVNEALRRALYSANLTAQDLAATLHVDPKTRTDGYAAICRIRIAARR